jgi:hypothetical protein
MSNFDPKKLHVNFDEQLETQDADLPRCYTLTHSDRTGDLFLTIAPDYDHQQISGWYTRVMRDEVLGKWAKDDGLALHIHCHVSGGFVLGPAKWRASIFRQHLPMVLGAICYGDREFIEHDVAFLNVPIKVHFHAKQPELDNVEDWGRVGGILEKIKGLGS